MTETLAAIELRILDPRLRAWGFPVWGSSLAAALDLHACIDTPLLLEPHGAAVLISAGIAVKIGDPDWCALILPRSGRGHDEGLVLGNLVGVIDADYEGPCLISAWNRAAEGTIAIEPGDRIAQLLFTRIARPQLVIVGEFSERTVRGTAGFGSTGRRGEPRAGSSSGSIETRYCPANNTD